MIHTCFLLIYHIYRVVALSEKGTLSWRVPEVQEMTTLESLNTSLVNQFLGYVEKMVEDKEEKDRHFPISSQDNVLRKLFSNPKKFNAYVTEGQVVADLGCGPGYFTLPLAECVGSSGKVYAVDSNEKAIFALQRKANRHGYSNIETHASSASDLSFIKDKSVDFVLANGLLCSMAPRYHESAVSEIKRILKPQGKAYLAVAKGRFSYVCESEWEQILEGFRVEQRGDPKMGDRWAVASIMLQ